MTPRLTAALDALRETLTKFPPDRQDAVARELTGRYGADPEPDAPEPGGFHAPPRPTAPDDPNDVAAAIGFERDLRAWNVYHAWPEEREDSGGRAAAAEAAGRE